jgi:diguanylate cyclase (GGDEF)-like protein
MSHWLFPIVIELCMTLVFCGVLFYLRKTLTPGSVALWFLLWAVRGAALLAAWRLVSSAERLIVPLYTPLQITSAVVLAVIAVGLEHQKDQIESLKEELARLRKQAADQLDVDPLTALLNRSALARWMEEEQEFVGLVVVCDMDDFKPLNDYYGHLVGDEILHGVGKLIRGSIRNMDLAFRWGGDEFVIFFRNEDANLVKTRMRSLAERLESFHIRNHGAVPVRFSWGMAPAAGRPLRDSLAEADRNMYEAKRTRHMAVDGPPHGGASLANDAATT